MPRKYNSVNKIVLLVINIQVTIHLNSKYRYRSNSDLLAGPRQVSPLHLNHATVHSTTHLTAFASSFPVLPPTINFGLNATEIGSRNVQQSAVPRATAFLRQIKVPLIIKIFIHQCNEGNVRHSVLQLREISRRTSPQSKYYSEHYFLYLDGTFNTEPSVIL